MNEPSFWRRRVVAPILGQLRQGITPEKIALTLSLGGILGIFPIVGATVLLCALAGFWLRLNQPIIQLTNFFMYPVQLVLLVPFYRAGETLFGQPYLPIFSATELLARFQAGPWQFVADYGMVGVYGIVVWCLTMPPLAAAAYFILRPLLKTLSSREKAA